MMKNAKPLSALPEAMETFAPDPQSIANSQLSSFIDFCQKATSRSFRDYASFEQFSIQDFSSFWDLFLDWSKLWWEGDKNPTWRGTTCADSQFFPNLRLNYAENLLLGDEQSPAITACRRNGQRRQLTRGELAAKVAQLAKYLKKLGLQKGDRIVAIARNNLEVVIAALAASAIGATFSSCSPDMGAFSILARFAPLSPSVLFANIASEPCDLGFSISARVAEVVKGLPTLSAIISLDDGPAPVGLSTVRTIPFLDCFLEDSHFTWDRWPFNQSLFILFSSGTTGQPKCIVHGAGGTLLEHAKEHRLHCDLRPGDKLLFQTSCGWMMWNWQLSALVAGAEIVVYDGPLEGPETFWRIVADERVTVFGTNPAYLQFCESTGFSPREMADYGPLRSILSTGSILFPRQYDWISQHVKSLPVQSISGGTDIIGCFVLGNPNRPVYRGQAQCRSLGMDVAALPEGDRRIGELICANPFPSRPLGFYGDETGDRFHQAYFSKNPGVWTHGDLIEFTPQGGAIMHGRSDGVLNVRGVRVGPAEIYQILQNIPEIVGAAAVEQTCDVPGGSRLLLLVVLAPRLTLDEALMARIRGELRSRGSPALVPARIAQVDALPVTYSGKQSETAICDAVNGRPVRNKDALRNPECLVAIGNHPALRVTIDAEQPQPEVDLDASHQLEHELHAIFRKTTGISSIKWSDNFFDLGIDSLALLNLRFEIAKRIKRELPLTALLLAPTIEQLAAFLRRQEMSDVNWRSDSKNGGQASHCRTWPDVRAAGPRDVELICRFLQHGFNKHGVPSEAWKTLFDYRWLDRKPDLGHVLTVRDEIVGFLGTIYATRKLGGKIGPVCNYTSWYVLPEYRGWSVELLREVLQNEQMSFTALTPAPTVVNILEAMGFTRFNSRKLAMPPLLHMSTFPERKISINFDLKIVRESLDEEHRVIFDDHAPHACLLFSLTDGSEHGFLVVKRRKAGTTRLNRFISTSAGVPYSEILYCSNPSLVARHLERVKLSILQRQRTVLLVCDERLFSEQPKGWSFEAPELFRSSLFSAHEFDKLYSELTLLPI